MNSRQELAPVIVLLLAVIACKTVWAEPDHIIANLTFVESFAWGHVNLELGDYYIDAEAPPGVAGYVALAGHPAWCRSREAGMTDEQFGALIRGLEGHGLWTLKGDAVTSWRVPAPGFCYITARVGQKRMTLVAREDAQENRTFFAYLAQSPVLATQRQLLLREGQSRSASRPPQPRAFSIHGIRPGDRADGAIFDSSWKRMNAPVPSARSARSAAKQWQGDPIATWVDFTDDQRVLLVRGPELEYNSKALFSDRTTTADVVKWLGKPSTDTVDARGSHDMDYWDDGLRVIVYSSGEVYCIVSQRVDPCPWSPEGASDVSAGKRPSP